MLRLAGVVVSRFVNIVRLDPDVGLRLSYREFSAQNLSVETAPLTFF